MDTLLDMINELTFRLMAATNSTLFTSDRIKTEIQHAYLWATCLFVWNELVRAKITDSGANQQYYDYPSEFRTGTIVRLEYNGDEYERKNYEDFLSYIKNNASSTKKIFANYGRQYFIYPTPTNAVSEGITVWGAIQATQVTNNTDKTIFSLSNSEGNEAIVKKAFSVLTRNKNAANADKEEAGATAILTRLYKTQLDTTQRDQRIQHEAFNVPDYFGSPSGIANYGRFSYDPTGD